MKRFDLYSLGKEIARMLKSSQWDELAERYGYDFEFNVDDGETIRIAFQNALTECVGKLEESKTEINVNRFRPDLEDLHSEIECDIQFQRSTGILVTLILCKSDTIHLVDIDSYNRDYSF